MKFNGAISMFMYKVFLFLDVLGFLFLVSGIDSAESNIPFFIKLVIIWCICILFTFVFYNYRIYTRHLFSIYCVATLLHGYIHKKTESKYRMLYNAAIKEGSLIDFYESMLNRYDSLQDKVI